MTEQERLLAVLAGEKTDRPPCICPGGMMNMVTAALMEQAGVSFPMAHTDPDAMARLAASVWEEGCFENIGVPFCMTVEAEAMGAPVELGDRYTEPRVTGYPIKSVDDYAALPSIDMTQGRVRVVLDALRILRKPKWAVPVIGNITGPISVATSLLDPMVFYRELRKKPENAKKYVMAVADRLCAFAEAQIEAGAQVIAISDPSGTGEILGPKYFETYALPALNRIVDAVHAKKVPCIVHICGQMESVWAQMAQIRADALSFDSVVPMGVARQNLPGRVLMGNVSTYTLEFGTGDKIAQLADYAASHGADILAPACGLGMRTSLENEQAMLRWLLEKYHG